MRSCSPLPLSSCPLHVSSGAAPSPGHGSWHLPSSPPSSCPVPPGSAGYTHRAPITHFTPHTPHYTPHTTHSTPHTSHHTLHTTHLTPHTPHHTPHTTHSTPYTSHHTLHAIPHLTCYGTCRLWRWSCEEVSGDVVRVRHETCAWLGEGSVASATQESGTSLCGNIAVSSTHHMPCGPHCTTHLLFPLLDFLQ